MRTMGSSFDMTAAFYCFLLEPSWYLFQAINKTVPGSLAAEFDPALANEPTVCPALRVMPMGWQGACGLLQYFHRRLCFLPPPLGAGLDPSRETRRDMPLPLTMDKSRQDFLTVHLDGFSQAEPRAHLGTSFCSRGTFSYRSCSCRLDQLANPETARQRSCKKKTKLRILEHEGPHFAPTSSGWQAHCFVVRVFVRKSLAPSHKRKSLEDAGFELSNSAESSHQFLPVFGEWIRPEKLRARRRLLPESMIDDVLLAILSLPVFVADLRAKVSPLVVASDASEWGLGLSQTSSFTAQGQVALPEFQQATPKCSG